MNQNRLMSCAVDEGPTQSRHGRAEPTCGDGLACGAVLGIVSVRRPFSIFVDPIPEHTPSFIDNNTVVDRDEDRPSQGNQSFRRLK